MCFSGPASVLVAVFRASGGGAVKRSQSRSDAIFVKGTGWYASGCFISLVARLSGFLSMCEHDYPQCWFTLRLVLAKRRYRCVRESSFLGLCERRTDERVSCTRTEKINCVCNIVLNPIRWVGRSSSRQINHVDSQYIFLNGGRRRVAPSWLVEGGRGAGGAPVSPSATARSAAGVLDRPVSARPRFFTVVHAIDSCFRKFFLFFPGGVGGCCLPVSCGRAQNARKIFCFFCGWYVVESCSKLRVIPLAAGP